MVMADGITDEDLVAAAGARLICLDGAARLVRRSKRRLAGAIARHEIPAARVGRITLLPRRAVLAWAARTTTRRRPA